MPVVILHESLDGEFLFAVFDSFAGWVRKDAVATCEPTTAPASLERSTGALASSCRA